MTFVKSTVWKYDTSCSGQKLIGYEFVNNEDECSSFCNNYAGGDLDCN